MNNKHAIRMAVAFLAAGLAFPTPALASCESDQNNCEEACKSDLRAQGGQLGGLSGRQAGVLAGVLSIGAYACIEQCEKDFRNCEEEEEERAAAQRQQVEERRQAAARQQEQQRKQQEQQRAQQARAVQQSAQDDKGRRWLAEGYEHYKRKEYQDAVDFFESGLKLLPDNAEGRYYAALTYLALNKVREAEEHALRYLALEPDSPYASKLKRALPGLAARQQAEQRQAAEARVKREAEAQAKERERAARQASRPQLPAPVGEAVWQALESSEAYRNRPMPTRKTVRQRYNSKNNNCTVSEPGFTCSNSSYASETTHDGRGWRHKKYNFDSKSYDHVGGTARLNAEMSYGVHRGELMSTLGGFLMLSSSYHSLQSYVPEKFTNPDDVVTGPGRSSTVIEKFSALEGGLFPLKIGARLRMEWQERESLKFDSGVSVPDRIRTIKKSCQVTGNQSASTLAPHLGGTAWTITCQTRHDNEDKAYSQETVYLEELGVFATDVLYEIPTNEGKPPTYVMPKGAYRIKELGSKFGNLAETVEGYAVEITP